MYKVQTHTSGAIEHKASEAAESVRTHGSYTVGGVSAVSGPHPDTGEHAHWIEVDGKPVRMPQGGVDTHPTRHAAVFAAKCAARRRRRHVGIL